MTDMLAVLLDDAVAGTVTRLKGGRLRFDYDDDYKLNRARRPCLSQCRRASGRTRTAQSARGSGACFPTTIGCLAVLPTAAKSRPAHVSKA
jgi:hypothetical protein